MTLTTILFYVFAGMTGLSALLIFLMKNILYSAFLLLIALLGIAGIYVLAGADFLAGTQVVVYVGGVLILLMFGIMLTHKHPTLQASNKMEHTAPKSESSNTFLAIFVGFALFSFLVYTINQANFSELPHIQNGEIDRSSKVSKIGISFMTDYLIAFELIAIILLVALVGATRIASEK